MKDLREVEKEITDKWDKRIKFCLENPEHLNEWEYHFIASVEEQRDGGKFLTPKQVGKLYDIFHKVENEIG